MKFTYKAYAEMLVRLTEKGYCFVNFTARHRSKLGKGGYVIRGRERPL